MKEESHNPSIDQELEARIVALVLGEASDFERDELNRLIDQRPELAALKVEIQSVHGLLLDVGTGESAADEDDWKLSDENRSAVLAVISGEAKEQPGTKAVSASASKQPFVKGKLFWNLTKIAAVFCLVGFFGILGMSYRRFNSRAVSSSNNFKQLGLGTHNYHSAYRQLRAGTDGRWDDSPETSAPSSKYFLMDRDETVRSSGAITGGTNEGYGAISSPEVELDYAQNSKSSLSAIRDSLDLAATPASPYNLKDDVPYSTAAPTFSVPQDSATWRMDAPSVTRNLESTAKVSGPVPPQPTPDTADFIGNGRASRDEKAITEFRRDGESESGGESQVALNKGVATMGESALKQIQERALGFPNVDSGTQRSGQSNDSSRRSSRESAVPGAERDVDGEIDGEMAGGQGGGGMGGGGAIANGALPAGASRETFFADPNEITPRGSASLPASGKWEKKGPASPTAADISGEKANRTSEIQSPHDNFNASGIVRSVPNPTNGPTASGERVKKKGAVIADGRMDGITQESLEMPDNLGIEFPKSRTIDRLDDQPMQEGAAVGQAPGASQSRLAKQDGGWSYEDRAKYALGELSELNGSLSDSQPNDYRKSVERYSERLLPKEQAALDTLQMRSGQVNTYMVQPGKLPVIVADTEPADSAEGEFPPQGLWGAIGHENHWQFDVPPMLVDKSKSMKKKASKDATVAGDVITRGYVARRRIANQTKKSAVPAGLDEKEAKDEAFSTFSLHVSDVSFKLAQAALARGEWPEAAKTRIEEFVNAFDYGDPMPSQGEHVACRMEQSIHPFIQQRNLLRVSMRTAAAGRSSNTPLRLTLLLDNSGSMERIDRQQTVRRAFALLAQQLKPIDQVTLISFARQPRLLADKVSGAESQQLVELVSNLPSEGGTNIEAALQLAFEKAREQQVDAAQNRIILLTDGAVNLGDANPESLSRMITTMRGAGIAFDAAGISAEGLNDEILEALTRKGDGRYYLLDSVETADDGFARQIAGALRPSAKNVKVQIEFNPKRVGRYKLLGFEKHRLKQEDFRNDKVDAAEMAAAEAGVAVYQFEAKPDGEGDVGSVSVRFRDLSTGQMVENCWPIPYEADAPRIDQAAPSLRIATAAALLAAKLRGEALGESVDLKTLSKLIAGLPVQDRDHKRVRQLQLMIDQARQVSGQ